MSGPGINLKSPEMLAAVDAIVLRAEKQGESAPSYVDAGQTSKLAVVDNQIGYGRRGTGKTHLLRELANKIEAKNLLVAGGKEEIAITLDLQKMVTSPSDRPWVVNPFTAAAGIFPYIVSEITNKFFNLMESHSRCGIWPNDRMMSDGEATEILQRILYLAEGSYQKPQHAKLEAEQKTNFEAEDTGGASLKLSNSGVAFDLSQKNTEKEGRSLTGKEAGESALVIQFPDIIQAFEQVLSGLGLARVWLLIDEWSFLPLEVQPYLADLLRRTFAPSPQFTIKIMCLPHKTNLSINTMGRTVGFEIGGDIFPGIDLDDILIFSKAPEAVELVFAKILHSHLTSSGSVKLPDPDNSLHAFANALFSDRRALVELIKASEGNPRDFLHIFVTAYRATIESPHIIAIGIPVIRNAAADWFERDKLKNINPDQKKILQSLIADVIKSRKSKLFLVHQDKSDSIMIRDLQHSRLLHRWHRGYAAKDGQSSERYDIYAIDYGAYVDLRSTELGRQITERYDNAEESIEVPDPDKRGFRHIVVSDELIDKYDQMLAGVIECPHCRSRFNPNQKSYVIRRLCPECFEPVESENVNIAPDIDND